VISISPDGQALALRAGTVTVTTILGALRTDVTVTARTMRFVTLSTSQADHTCGLTDDSVAVCWGANDLGQLGVPALPQSASPIASANGPRFASVAAGATFTCAEVGSGAVDCWGSSSRGRLGAGTAQLSTASPVLVPINTALHGLVSGWNHSCGVDRGETICWGENPAAGGTGAVSWTPTQLTGSTGFTRLMAAVGFGCGIASGAASCWGNNPFGQLGNGSTTATAVPLSVAGGLQFTALAGGWTHTCGITTSGAGECWGDGRAGQLGAGDTASHLTPVAVSGGLTFTSIAAGASRTCAVATDGTGYCWGSGTVTPAAIPGAPTFTSIVLGDYHTCALGTDGRAYCWGLNTRGQLGDGTFADRTAPTVVLGQP
jgi:alpha-tubulin suppressor-like RCC1 family protein